MSDTIETFLKERGLEPLYLFLSYSEAHNLLVTICLLCQKPDLDSDEKLYLENLRTNLTNQIITQMPDSRKYYITSPVIVPDNPDEN